MTIQIIKADITELKVDAIVNAANPGLVGGGGVDGAIHAAAGPELAEEAKKFAPLATGQAVATLGYNLHAKAVVHTVGPVWKGGESGEIIALAECYKNSLSVANSIGARSLAIPAISTGVYAFPAYEAAIVAIVTVNREIVNYPHMDVYFTCFDDEMLETYKRAVAALSNKQEVEPEPKQVEE